MATTLRTGVPAYFDTFAGLVPCRVLSVHGSAPVATSSVKVTFEITKDRGAYRRGEILLSSSLWVVPTGCVRRSEYSTFITPYRVGDL